MKKSRWHRGILYIFTRTGWKPTRVHNGVTWLLTRRGWIPLPKRGRRARAISKAGHSLTTPQTAAPSPALPDIIDMVRPPGLQIVVWANKYRELAFQGHASRATETSIDVLRRVQ
jgi:hypothetical protein